MTEEHLRLLLIETSGQPGQVGLAKGDRLLCSRSLSAARRHARDLAPTVKALLAELGWRPRDLQAVAVSRGPGSYTGLRVGIISAKALAYALNIPILAVDTFPILALQAGPGEDLDVLEDAQQDKVYVQRFRWAATQTRPEPLDALTIRPFSDWLRDLPPNLRVTGPALEVASFRTRLPPTVRVLPQESWHPQLAAMLTLARDQWARGEVADLWRLEPLYLRPSEAEEAWERRKPATRS
ncbi:MAG: tRNA (adenosine(37)-N6)-threonylcarbamoyltransferase complex dimerization subunit type 1 TsaB [Gemmatales bacterium]|nr:tRNA (adenosine(37)-N6)-threonylcarbamoyltransferase complex dimerization subunit type 1 TsaB [Gemmatales bacterium]MDW7995018.1 tRNA (adenosine(37)-N6)-threonylcarbamoyltransferase complex dimerization subunit type 1 TsaB [Gemmatales bacterium]